MENEAKIGETYRITATCPGTYDYDLCKYIYEELNNGNDFPANHAVEMGRAISITVGTRVEVLQKRSGYVRVKAYDKQVWIGYIAIKERYHKKTRR